MAWLAGALGGAGATGAATGAAAGAAPAAAGAAGTLGAAAPAAGAGLGAAAAPAAASGLAGFGQGLLQGLQGAAGTGAGALGSPAFNWPTAAGQTLGGMAQSRMPGQMQSAMQMVLPQSPTQQQRQPMYQPQFGSPQLTYPGFPQLQQMLRGYNGFY